MSHLIKLEGGHNTSASTLGDSFLNSSQQYLVHGDGNEGDESGNMSLTGGHDDHSNDGSKEMCEPLREQDRFLPIANVARIMKTAIPKSGKIAKDAKECVQECVSEFVSFITSEASDRCHQEKRKTINGEDILFAMSTLGFDNYVEPLKLYLQKYREEVMKGEKGSTMANEGVTLDEMSDESFGGQSLNATILTEEGTSQPNVIYTTSYGQHVFKINQ